MLRSGLQSQRRADPTGDLRPLSSCCLGLSAQQRPICSILAKTIPQISASKDPLELFDELLDLTRGALKGRTLDFERSSEGLHDLSPERRSRFCEESDHAMTSTNPSDPPLVNLLGPLM